MYVNLDLVKIQESLDTETLSSFYRFCGHLTKMKAKAKESKVEEQEELIKRLARVAKSYISNSYTKDCSDDIKKTLSRYVSSLLDVDIDKDEVKSSIAIPFIPSTPVNHIAKRGYVKANVIVLNGASILLCKSNDVWHLPGGFTRDGESARTGAIRSVREQTGVTLTGHRVHMINAYESDCYDQTERYIIVNYMYAPTFKTYPYGGSCDKSEMVKFDMAISMNIDTDDYKIIKNFIMG